MEMEKGHTGPREGIIKKSDDFPMLTSQNMKKHYSPPSPRPAQSNPACTVDRQEASSLYNLGPNVKLSPCLSSQLNSHSWFRRGHKLLYFDTERSLAKEKDRGLIEMGNCGGLGGERGEILSSCVFILLHILLQSKQPLATHSHWKGLWVDWVHRDVRRFKGTS